MLSVGLSVRSQCRARPYRCYILLCPTSNTCFLHLRKPYMHECSEPWTRRGSSFFDVPMQCIPTPLLMQRDSKSVQFHRWIPAVEFPESSTSHVPRQIDWHARQKALRVLRVGRGKVQAADVAPFNTVRFDGLADSLVHWPRSRFQKSSNLPNMSNACTTSTYCATRKSSSAAE